MKVDINRKGFVAANLLELDNDVESVFQVDASSGIQGQLLKLKKSARINLNQALNILIGRLACIGEEWDYKDFKETHWGNIFNPPQEYSVYLLKSYQEVDANLFIEKIEQFKNHLMDKEEEESVKLNYSYFGGFIFNGKNVSDYLSELKEYNSVKDLNFGPFDLSEKAIAYANKDLWNWQVWFVEGESAYYLFEEVIVT